MHAELRGLSFLLFRVHPRPEKVLGQHSQLAQ